MKFPITVKEFDVKSVLMDMPETNSFDVVHTGQMMPVHGKGRNIQAAFTNHFPMDSSVALDADESTFSKAVEAVRESFKETFKHYMNKAGSGTIYFSPANRLSTVNQIAKEIYLFAMENTDTNKLELMFETNFVIFDSKDQVVLTDSQEVAKKLEGVYEDIREILSFHGYNEDHPALIEALQKYVQENKQ